MEIVLNKRGGTQAAVVALGMFDGVHIGHQVLLQRARALADKAGVPMVVYTFIQHPMELIAPEKAPALLTTLEERAQIMEGLGADMLCAMPFDQETMNQPPECFIGELVRRFHPTDIVCGYNYSFGQKGSGSPGLLQALGGALRYHTSVVPRITFHGQDVSSTAVRALLMAGDARAAWNFLGRPYQRQVELVQGDEGQWWRTEMLHEKQNLGSGCYRGMFQAEGKAWPVSLMVGKEGQTQCYLPLKEAHCRQGTLCYYCGRLA